MEAQPRAGSQPGSRAVQERGRVGPSRAGYRAVRERWLMGVRVGILALNDPRRGLWRDAEALLWALQAPSLRHGGAEPASVTLFPIARLRQAEQGAKAEASRVPCNSAVAPGTPLSQWLAELDVLVVCEVLLPSLFAQARQQGVRVVYVPNLEWATAPGGVPGWCKRVRESGCQVWAKSAQIAAALAGQHLESDLVPWSIPDPVRRDRCARPIGPVTFLLNAGMGGWRQRRGVDIALRAFALVRHSSQDIALLVKTIKPLARYAPADLLDTPGLRVVEGLLSRPDLMALHEEADAVLYPSRWEGFGLSLLEALHAGLPVLATDGWPMNELVEHGHNGLLAAADQVGMVRLAAHWECDPQALAAAMLRFSDDPELRRRLTCPEPAELASRQQRFILRVRELLLQEEAPRVVLFRPRSKSGWRRSEEYWADALRMHGYQVEVGHYEDSTAHKRSLLARPHDFVLVGKAPPAVLAALRPMTAAPLVLWHHDLCWPRRRWVEQAAPLVDLLAVPESGLADQLPGVRTPVLTLLPGAKVDGNRGPGRRPASLPEADEGPDVVFLGNACRAGSRIQLLQALNRRFDVQVYGANWSRSGIPSNAPVWGKAAAAVLRRARLVLSVSYSASTPHYTSNRLFNSCGAGACVVAERYPGIDEHYPAEAVARFADIQECSDIVASLLVDPARRASMRAAGEDHTWRTHTWADRVAELLAAVSELPSPAATSLLVRSAQQWDQRARRLGPRAVGYYRWDERRFQAESAVWWQRLSQYLEAYRKPSHDTLLDFGCGSGRFTARLARTGFNVVGADPAPAMAALARRQVGRSARIVRLLPGAPLPFESGQFDGLWVCTVLQHVPDEAIKAVVGELRRVVRPGGLVLLCENTQSGLGRTSNSGHVVFRTADEYAAFFPGVAVTEEFVSEGERHTVLVGYLREV
ncbi:MAG: methyltransferase domain-containing protein [Anaerolineae bacterium]|nr:methyltransferase domain-containing protein [Anaerolineae bacterium]